MHQRLSAVLVTLLAFLVASPWAGSRLAAQEDTTRIPTGVRLGLLYQTTYRPKVAVRPLEAARGAEGAAQLVQEIIGRNLDYSDRFEMYEVPPSLARGPVEYATWDGIGVVFLVTGDMEPDGDGFVLRLVLHDVVYGSVKEIHAFSLPQRDHPDFRLAVHATSDEIVRWITGQRGKAASRIAFVRVNSDGTRDLMVVDSDGENLRRIHRNDGPMLSPAWSPDGRRIAYSALRDGESWEVRERELATDRVRVISARPGANWTPRYSPDGTRLAFSVTQGNGTAIYEYDIQRDCCLRQVTRGPLIDMSPTYSPDGRRIAFNSDRIGQPHIYVTSLPNGDAELVSPFVFGEPAGYYAPEWSPNGTLLAFHGRSRGGLQIMVADVSRPGDEVRQITDGGRSEDPSWAPNGRHIVFSGMRAQGSGLYVIDTATGRLRPLVVGGTFRTASWSGPLLEASALVVRGP